MPKTKTEIKKSPKKTTKSRTSLREKKISPKKTVAVRTRKKASKKTNVSHAEQIAFLSNVLDKMVQTKNHYDIRSEIILGVSAVVFLFSVGYIMNDTQRGVIGFLVISMAALIASMMSLYSVITPQIFKREETKKSVLHHGFLSSFTQKTAQSKYMELMNDQESIINEYTKEIYNIARNSISVKKVFNQRAVTILIWGLFVGFVLILFLP